MTKSKSRHFYETVTIAGLDNGHTVLLDGRRLKTPGKQPLIVSSPQIAKLIATEWQAQDELIRPETMPVTRLVNVAIELTPDNRPKLVAEARSYGATDTLCHRDGPGALNRHQARHWDPVLDWASGQGIALVSEASVMAIEQPEEALDRIADYARDLDDISLTLFVHLTAVYGSVVLALAVFEGHVSGSRAFELSRLDEAWQVEHWGEDEEAAARTRGLRAEVRALCAILGDDYV